MGCRTAPDQPEPVTLPETIRLSEGHSERVLDGLFLQVNELTDSRCPIGKQCIWYGNVDIVLTAQVLNEQQTLHFCLGACQQGQNTRDSVNVRFASAQYRVVLTEVTPYPGTTSGGLRVAMSETNHRQPRRQASAGDESTSGTSRRAVLEVAYLK